MTQLPLGDWQSSLEGMEQALVAALAALDRCQAGWESAMARDMAPASPQPVRDYLEDRLREWDARLLAATELAASVEADLHDRELAVGRWQSSIHQWQNGNQSV
ncbi:MAG TPA: hypothetical protein VN641_19800 [Urbifossiella sp.]|nr:hypothetical protein [Urbifossiella sp.]